MAIHRSMPLNLDATLTGGNGYAVKAVAFLTIRNPTVCGRVGRDKRYYCIREDEHRGRHRYGVVYEGRWEGTVR